MIQEIEVSFTATLFDDKQIKGTYTSESSTHETIWDIYHNEAKNIIINNDMVRSINTISIKEERDIYENN